MKRSRNNFSGNVSSSGELNMFDDLTFSAPEPSKLSYRGRQMTLKDKSRISFRLFQDLPETGFTGNAFRNFSVNIKGETTYYPEGVKIIEEMQKAYTLPVMTFPFMGGTDALSSVQVPKVVRSSITPTFFLNSPVSEEVVARQSRKFKSARLAERDAAGKIPSYACPTKKRASKKSGFNEFMLPVLPVVSPDFGMSLTPQPIAGNGEDYPTPGLSPKRYSEEASDSLRILSPTLADCRSIDEILPLSAMMGGEDFLSSPAINSSRESTPISSLSR